MSFSLLSLGLAFAFGSHALAQDVNDLLPCGEARYRQSEYTCYDSTFLCPVLDVIPTQRCNNDCYLESEYSCAEGRLTWIGNSGGDSPDQEDPEDPTGTVPPIPGSSAPACDEEPSQFFIPSTPYANYFLSTCHVESHLILTSPVEDSNLTIIGPRLIAAFPAGNSGVAAFFAPQSGINGTLTLSLVNSTYGSLDQVYIPSDSETPSVGISAVLEFNDSAILTVPILGGIRNIRDFTEGPSILVPEIQDALETTEDDGSVTLKRLWFDNVTTTWMGFIPVSDGAAMETGEKNTVSFTAGQYQFYTHFNFPQLDQLSSMEVLNEESQSLIQDQPGLTSSLAFLSYTDKLLAGTWRFLTYFGRDSMISALLLQPVLSSGENSAMEAVIGAVLERINGTDGSVSHEETLGDYATYLNMMNNDTSTAPMYTYPMIDVDYFLPIIMDRYFATSTGQSRAQALLETQAGQINPMNEGKTWGELATTTADKIMGIAAHFAAEGNQTQENLAHLKENEIVGQWRDSTYGLGGGRIPYDVNTALIPAALRSISQLSSDGIFPEHDDWADLARQYADIWEEETLQFFSTTLDADTARDRLAAYAERASFPGPTQADTISAPVSFDAIALDGYNNLSKVNVMHSDTCFRLFLLNGTSAASTALLNRTATSVRQRFPLGLMSDVGLLVANPALGEDPVYAANFTTSAYHGTVVWSWQMAMMAKGLELQLARCEAGGDEPSWCGDASVAGNVKGAYNELWDVIERNEAVLSGEVWSFRYDAEEDRFEYVELGELPPPGGVNPTESNVRQLWSLTFLAVTRNEDFR